MFVSSPRFRAQMLSCRRVAALRLSCLPIQDLILHLLTPLYARQAENTRLKLAMRRAGAPQTDVTAAGAEAAPQETQSGGRAGVPSPPGVEASQLGGTVRATSDPLSNPTRASRFRRSVSCIHSWLLLPQRTERNQRWAPRPLQSGRTAAPNHCGFIGLLLPSWERGPAVGSASTRPRVSQVVPRANRRHHD